MPRTAETIRIVILPFRFLLLLNLYRLWLCRVFSTRCISVGLFNRFMWIMIVVPAFAGSHKRTAAHQQDYFLMNMFIIALCCKSSQAKKPPGGRWLFYKMQYTQSLLNKINKNVLIERLNENTAKCAKPIRIPCLCL